MEREPAVSGFFYPSGRAELENLLRRLDTSVPEQETCAQAIGVMVPHAGLIYSGITAMFSYKALKGTEERRFLIIGPNHESYPYYSAAYPDGGWKTPLGTSAIDSATTRDLLSEATDLVVDAGAHSREHSIEVQLPFLQYVFGDSISICPIVLGDQSEHTSLKLAKAISRLPHRPILVASSDLTHYERIEVAKRKDEEVIEAILTLDTHRLYEVIQERRITACGFGAIAVLMEVTRISGGSINLLDYRTSGDTSGDKSSVVGYASLISCSP